MWLALRHVITCYQMILVRFSFSHFNLFLNICLYKETFFWWLFLEEKKLTTEIEIEIRRPLDRDAWWNLKNNKDRTFSLLPQLAPSQSYELEPFSKAFQWHLENLGFDTAHHTIRKTDYGYTFRRLCTSCSASFNFLINIIDSVGTISIYEKCKQHRQQ